MKNTILKIFNKRVLLFTFCFEIIVIVMTSILGAQEISLQKNIISKNKINYSTALELHNRGKYLEAYNQFTNIMNTKDDIIITSHHIPCGKCIYCRNGKGFYKANYLWI